jgi:hypothetical protein
VRRVLPPFLCHAVQQPPACSGASGRKALPTPFHFTTIPVNGAPYAWR